MTISNGATHPSQIREIRDMCKLHMSFTWEIRVAQCNLQVAFTVDILQPLQQTTSVDFLLLTSFCSSLMLQIVYVRDFLSGGSVASSLRTQYAQRC